MLTTPAGTSELLSTSAKVTAGIGDFSEASTTAVLPGTSTGANRVTSPNNAGSSGAMTPTTPVGSGEEMLKKGPATGFRFPYIWANLSAQPAYQTRRSVAEVTSLRAADRALP